MTTLTRAIRKRIAELSKHSNSDLEELIGVSTQWKDDAPLELMRSVQLQKYWVQRLLDTRLGRKKPLKIRKTSEDASVASIWGASF